MPTLYTTDYRIIILQQFDSVQHAVVSNTMIRASYRHTPLEQTPLGEWEVVT